MATLTVKKGTTSATVTAHVQSRVLLSEKDFKLVCKCLVVASGGRLKMSNDEVRNALALNERLLEQRAFITREALEAAQGTLGKAREMTEELLNALPADEEPIE